MGNATTYLERRWTSPDGLRLYARDYPAAHGEARLPVVCLHGLTRNSRDFEQIAPRIASWGRRVIVPDVRGRGQSSYDPDPRNYQPKVYARDIAELLVELGIGRAIFLGTSMGGIITMALATVKPGAVAAAILNDVGPEVGADGIARILGYTGKAAPIRDWDEAAAYVRRINGAAFPAYGDEDWRRFARRTFREGPEAPELDYDPAIAGALRKPGPLARWLAKLMFRRLARGRPLLLVRGERSDIITSDIARRMQRLAPSMQRIDVPGVGHAPTLDEPEAVDAIARFLRTLP